jgi:hypothetical protein
MTRQLVCYKGIYRACTVLEGRLVNRMDAQIELQDFLLEDGIPHFHGTQHKIIAAQYKGRVPFPKRQEHYSIGRWNDPRYRLPPHDSNFLTPRPLYLHFLHSTEV